MTDSVQIKRAATRKRRRSKPANSVVIDDNPVDPVSVQSPDSWPTLLRLIPKYDPYRDAGDCWFDESAANRVVEFFAEFLHHIEGAVADKPFILEPWQKAVVGNLFGWKRPDGTRRYREGFIFVSRKNGKTPLCAGIVDYVLFCDGESGAQIYGAAADIPQAGLLFRHAAGMIEREPELRSRCTVYDSYRSVVRKDDKASAYKVISGEAKGKHGQNSHLVVVDEEHEQSDRELIDTLRTSFASSNRKQPLFLHVTTAGFDRHSVCHENYEYACKVRDGIIHDPAYLPVIYEMEEGADWKDESSWKSANPNLGVSVSIDYLRRECAKAIENPSYENTFKRLHLNVWTEQAIRWIPMDAWDRCTDPIDAESLRGMPCYVGIDLSSTRDITAVVLDFLLDGGKHLWLPKFWVPGESAEARERQDRIPYVSWSRNGFVEMTNGWAVDYDVVLQYVLSLPSMYDVRGVGIDPWNATEFEKKLQSNGIEPIPVRQGYPSLNSPSKELERLVVTSKLVHGNHPVLRWMASNVTIDTDPAGNIKPSKDKSSEKIDGIVAGIMALALSMQLGSDVSDGGWGFVL